MIILCCIRSLYVKCSLRAVYGSDEQKNGLHASDSVGGAAREIKFIFPDSEYAICMCNMLLPYTQWC